MPALEIIKEGMKGEGERLTPFGLLVPAMIMAAAVLSIYLRTISYPFQFDDISYIVENGVIRDISNFWPPLGTRYLGHLSFALNYALSGLNPAAFRATNIAVHAVNSYLVFLLGILTFRTERMRASAPDGRTGYYASLSAALIFAAHPVNTQAVTYVTQRFASLATMFFLLSLVSYIRARLEGRSARPLFYAASLVFAAAAQKTKEISFTLPFVIALCEFAFLGAHGLKERALRLLPFFLLLAIIPLTLFFESGLTSGIAAKIRMMQLEEMAGLSRHDYLITQFRVLVTYIRLFLLPVNQRLVYDFDLYRSFLDPEAVLSFLFLSAVFSFAVLLFVRSIGRGEGLKLLISFGIVWFFVTVSVESSVIPIKDLAFEHRVYLPSIGGALSASAFIFFALGRFGKRAFKPGLLSAALVMALTAVPLAAASYARNGVWSDGLTLWLDTVKKSPRSPRAHYNLAYIYHTRGFASEAVEHYLEAIRLAPDKEEAHYNLAVLYQAVGDNAGAIAHFRESILLKPGKKEAHYNLGIAYYETGDNASAIASYREALRIDPGDENAHYNLACAYQENGDLAGAEKHYSEAIRLNPESADAHFRLGTVYAIQGRAAEARESFNEALETDPGYGAAAAWLRKLPSGAR